METLELCRNDFGLWVVKAGRVEERKCKDKLGEVLGSKKKKKKDTILSRDFYLLVLDFQINYHDCLVKNKSTLPFFWVHTEFKMINKMSHHGIGGVNLLVMEKPNGMDMGADTRKCT